MVTVSSYRLVEKKNGGSFVSLELTGSLEILQSSNTGRFYANVSKCRIPSTFSEEIAKTLVGSKIEGEIIREECEPYDFTNPTTGEILTLQHTYAYRPVNSMELIGHTRVSELERA